MKTRGADGHKSVASLKILIQASPAVPSNSQVHTMIPMAQERQHIHHIIQVPKTTCR